MSASSPSASSTYVRKESDNRVTCLLCPHNCTIGLDKFGFCHTRFNKDGQLHDITYGRLSAVATDPIEKKPLNHFRPGSQTFSIGTDGCNLICPFCQNHSLSQRPRTKGYNPDNNRVWKPEEVIAAAKANDCESISFTYSEPTLSMNFTRDMAFARDTAAAADGSGIDLIYVTNGQINREPAMELTGYLGAANVDLKCFSHGSYKDVLKGSLQATLDTIEIFATQGVWTEVTTLVVPGFNDSVEELSAIAKFVAQLNPNIPWHVSRFHPTFNWTDRPHTPLQTLQKAFEIGVDAGLKYVYTGNMPGDLGEKIRCHNCDAVVIDRVGYRIGSIETNEGKCKMCNTAMAGVGFP